MTRPPLPDNSLPLLWVAVWAATWAAGRDIRCRWQRLRQSKQAAADLTAQHAAHAAAVDWQAFMAGVREALTDGRIRRADDKAVNR